MITHTKLLTLQWFIASLGSCWRHSTSCFQLDRLSSFCLLACFALDSCHRANNPSYPYGESVCKECLSHDRVGESLAPSQAIREGRSVWVGKESISDTFHVTRCCTILFVPIKGVLCHCRCLPLLPKIMCFPHSANLLLGNIAGTNSFRRTQYWV